MKIGTAAEAGAVVNLPVLGRNVSPAQALGAFQRAAFDERFAECRAFAAEMHGAGVSTSAIRGDVATLWCADPRAHLSENRLPVAGLTDRTALFCLEELARDVGMRDIFRADHIINQNGHARHTAVGSVSLQRNLSGSISIIWSGMVLENALGTRKPFGILVAGDCNAPNALRVPFRVELTASYS